MGQAKRKRGPNLDVPLSGVDAFQVTLLATCDTTHLILQKMVNDEPDKKRREQRKYWIERLGIVLEALNQTYDGHVTEEFENRFKKYHAWLEKDMESLLKHYKPKG